MTARYAMSQSHDFAAGRVDVSHSAWPRTARATIDKARAKQSVSSPRPVLSPWRQKATFFGPLVAAIELWAAHWNDDPKPFIWHKTAYEIIEKVCRGRSALHQIKSAPDH